MLGLQRSVNVKKIGPTLVAGFHRATPPLIWKFDLERNHSFTIGLQGDDGDWELGLTSPKGDFYVIARFANHDYAEQAFNEVQKALMRHKWMGPSLPKTVTGWLGMFLLLFIIFTLVATVRGVSTGSITGFPGHAAFAPPSLPKNGLPQSADDILTPPKAP